MQTTYNGDGVAILMLHTAYNSNENTERTSYQTIYLLLVLLSFFPLLSV